METLLQFIASHEHVIGPIVLFAASVVEYLFPPFPGDTVTVFGAFLVVSRDWSMVSVLSAVTLGSVTGCFLDYQLGAWIAKRGKAGRLPGFIQKLVPGKDHLEQISLWFGKYGLWLIAANRFMPGIRAFFFVAAGMIGLSRRTVILLGAVSALAFNTLLCALGLAAGAGYQEMRSTFQGYTEVMWMSMAGLVLISAMIKVIQWIRKRRNGR